MTGTKSTYEDYHGATPDYPETCECDECGVTLHYDRDYFAVLKDGSYCRHCVNTWDEERIVEKLGYTSVFDLIHDLS